MEKFVDNIGDNTLIYSDAILVDDKSEPIGKELIRPNGNLIRGRCNLAFLFYNCVSGNTLMFKREIVDSVLPIPKEALYHDIWIAFVASTLGTIDFIEEPLTLYRRYSEQVTRTVEKEYKSFKDRSDKKEKIYKSHAKYIVNYCSVFRDVDGVTPQEKSVLDTIMDHYLNFERGYFNSKMYRCLKENKDRLFAIKQPRVRDRYIRRYSMKLKLLKILFYSV